MDQEKVSKEKKEIATSLEELIDKMQVKASLFKLESQSAWQDLQTGVKKIKTLFRKDVEKAQQDLDEVQVQGHLAIMEAKEEWNQIKEYINQAINELQGGQETLDKMRLQAHLAKMEATDRFTEQKKQWRDSYDKNVKPQLEDLLNKMKTEVEKIREDISKS